MIVLGMNQIQKNLAMWSAFHVQDNEKLCQYILLGADVNDFSEETGDNLFHGVLKRNESIAVIDFFLEHGADVDRMTRYGISPLWLAAKNCEKDTVERILSLRKNSDADNSPEGITPLMIAAKYANLEVVKLFIEHGFDANQMDGDGRTAYDHVKGSIWAIGDAKGETMRLLSAAMDKIRLDELIEEPVNGSVFVF